MYYHCPGPRTVISVLRGEWRALIILGHTTIDGDGDAGIAFTRYPRWRLLFSPVLGVTGALGVTSVPPGVALYINKLSWLLPSYRGRTIVIAGCGFDGYYEPAVDTLAGHGATVIWFPGMVPERYAVEEAVRYAWLLAHPSLAHRGD